MAQRERAVRKAKAVVGNKSLRRLLSTVHLVILKDGPRMEKSMKFANVLTKGVGLIKYTDGLIDMVGLMRLMNGRTIRTGLILFITGLTRRAGFIKLSKSSTVLAKWLSRKLGCIGMTKNGDLGILAPATLKKR